MSTTASSGEPTDEELFLAYVDGDRAAFAELFERYGPLVGRLVRRRVFDRDAAQDLVQQTFFQLHRARADFRRDGKLRPWVVTIALNIVRRHFRKLGRVTELELDPEGSWLPPTEAYDPVATERRLQLHRALAQLNEDQRRTIELHWLEGIPFPEVAEIVGASLSAVKVRAHRGYKQLRAIIEGMEDPPP